MYRLNISYHAESDLHGIISYIAKKLNSPQAATFFADEVYKCYERLENNPYIYEECHDPKLKTEGYRRGVFEKCLCKINFHK